MNFKISRVLLWLFYFGLCLLTLFSLLKYPGHGFVYILFSIVFNGLLFAGFRRNRLFFDTFIGLFFWLGFWFKFSVVLLFRGGYFPDSVGNFDFSGPAFDRALLVSSVGAVGFIIASFIREYYFSYAKSHVINDNRLILNVYKDYRNIILAFFFFLFVVVAGTNIWLGMYQRGGVPQTLLPFGLNGVYTWLLLFGLTSFSAVFLDYELRVNKNPYLVAFLSLLETFCSNVSMLSRGMVLNGSALIFGVHEGQKRQGAFLSIKFKVIVLTVFIALFVCSVFTVNVVRSYRFPRDSVEISSVKAMSSSYRSSYSIFVDRWVGIEAAMAVSSYKNLGWDLWSQAWQEKFSHTGTSFYDKEIAKSQYTAENLLNHHFISLPGILTFFYYPGSYLLLFFSMTLVGIIGAAIECIVYKLSGANIILCSLMGQVVAYRYAHFGYVPKQSYLLIGAIILNVFMVYFLNKLCKLSAKNQVKRIHIREKSAA